MTTRVARELTSAAELRDVLTSARTVAVLGAHHERARPAFYVPDYLHGVGARILPVNPALVGRTLWGEPVRASLADLHERVDVVDVFRRAEALAGHLVELLGMNPPPALVWFQQGIRDDAVAAALIAAGIDVVQDRCMLADHRRMGLGPIR
ncbi:MAG: CoA-binding protein [Pseudomonadota bacterium]|nr:CoA-binding protein [Pseudomonadota bacterium]